jgi:lipopolysaccharide export system protein LptA
MRKVVCLSVFFILAVSALAAAPSAKGKTERFGGGDPRVAGSIVRSKEWLVRRAPQREEEFIGDVSYHQGPNVLTADWALFRHVTQLWKARGHVKFVEALKSGDHVEVSGEDAEYDQKTKHGWLIGANGGPIAFKRSPAAGTSPDEGTAQRMDWEGRERAHLSGGVHAWGPRAELWGGEADYDATQGILTVSKDRPVLHVLQVPGDWTGAVQGTTLVVHQDPDRFQADGHTKGWIRFKDSPEKLLK